mmetsp:Transcript_63790/g.74718  ORF Transcript_63790/g.74718 Transcript_63790/m.74718 type:complete len:409 (-) Transcript_63790:113-1339(-)|eukprot:CAMPEP_0194434490 /NCGR_PEP_ID=MMETSP0176-20130528/83336_1 /TAXON_ID=216777 /ORGANISM="Proboscia alata, Strain PI-D3" /LENGTH=408 /DNA_ID=CAMNT_0039252833 /DNA_START=51 /DNA_END=1277 /DNA_ORIENTATION=+
MSKSSRCTCGPYPTVDFQSQRDYGSEEGIYTETQTKAKNACVQFGCFHFKMEAPQTDMNLEFCNTQVTEAALFPHVENKNDGIHGSQGVSIYRGRNAESGATNSSSESAEPKQSWEYHRCQFDTARCDGNECSSHFSSEGSPHSKVDNVLRRWTETMHKITTTICNVLNLPDEFIAIDDCQCKHADCDTTYSTPRCNSDLLRVFRYDPTTKISNNNDDPEVMQLGSSPHTDWGSLTVVWQDSIGGLQVYCHLHKKWNCVDPAPPVTAYPNSVKNVNVFVHVGDFLSLATKSICPSPMHRVISPSGGVERYSLVYFVYPPPGMTLKTAEEAIVASGSFGAGNEEENDGELILPTKLLKRYFVLHDQSSAPVSVDGVSDPFTESCIQTYASMRNTAFDLVIKQKWDQVQR